VEALSEKGSGTLGTSVEGMVSQSDAAPDITAKITQAVPGNEPAKLQMKAVLLQHAATFAAELPNELPPMRHTWTQVIPLEAGTQPTCKPMFRYSPMELEEMRKQVTALLRQGKIQPSSSPFGAPVLFAKKKTGGLRMCVDYRALNAVTIRNKYPLPRIDDLLDRLCGAQVFSSLDLTSAYHQIRLPDEDVPKTAFRTPFGSYEYRVMPFGLTNAPSVFVAHMNALFQDLPFVIAYLDDVLIFSRDEQEHVEHVRQVMQRLADNKYYVNLEKCAFFRTEVPFLGHLVTPQGVKPDPAKIKVVQQWPRPASLFDLRSFLGFCNYFRKYIKNYALTAGPLTSLTKGNISSRFSKQSSLGWTPECEQAFQALKDALTQAPVLALPNPSKAFTLKVVTDASDYALGAVLLQDGKPVAFESRKLTEPELKYTTGEKELLAVVHALKVWRCYLEGPHFTIMTDHHPLVHFRTQPLLSRQQARWSEYLQSFDYDWKYIKGEKNPADFLSRPPRVKPLPKRKIKVMLTCHEDTTKTNEHDSVTELIQALPNPDMKDGRIVVPGTPDGLREALIRSVHEAKWAGHPGQTKTVQLLSRYFWWSKMRRDVAKVVRQCDSCQRVKASRREESGLLQPLPVPNQCWWVITMDLITGLPKTSRGHDTILVVCDKLSKMVHYIPTNKHVTAKQIAELLIDNVVRLHGVPRQVISDRDPRFTAEFHQTFTTSLGIKCGFSTAHHPQTDGQTERVNQVLEDYLRHYIKPLQHDWDRHLAMAEFAYNNAYHEAIQSTPFRVTYGVDP
jgi:hypothetical protein